MSLSVGNIVDLLNQGGTTALLIVIVLGSYQGWWVWQGNYEDLREDRDWWRSTALDALGLTERTVSLHERLTEKRTP